MAPNSLRFLNERNLIALPEIRFIFIEMSMRILNIYFFQKILLAISQGWSHFVMSLAEATLRQFVSSPTPFQPPEICHFVKKKRHFANASLGHNRRIIVIIEVTRV